MLVLLKFEYEDRRLVSLILSGDESLDAAVREVPALATRLDIAVRLSGLDHEAAAAYVAHRMSLCAGDPSVIERTALAAIRASADGLPGRMNTLADNALFEAYTAGRPRITAADVARARVGLRWDLAPSEGESESVNLEPGPLPASAAEPLVALEEVYTELDAEFEAVFESATIVDTEPADRAPEPRGSPRSDAANEWPREAAGERSLELNVETYEVPIDGPPKEPEEELEDLLVELLDD